MLRHRFLRAALPLFAVIVAGTFHLLQAAEESPISSDVISADDSEATISAAIARGAASASRDIEAGTLRILYYGKPWSVGKSLVDDTTGYRVQILSGCVVTRPFVAEVEAYNGVMREWHARKNFSSTHR
ncbi:MAG: hypothetical protein QOD99_2185 [Chthoniobacter sp.]|jgi:hypothetical protein|nr:hypothetical protein [Chthoniobacter sp.]